MTDSVSFKMSFKGQSIGYKLTKLRDGRVLFTARDLSGKLKTSSKNSGILSVILPEGTEMLRQSFSVPVAGTAQAITAKPGRPGDKILLAWSSGIRDLDIEPIIDIGYGKGPSGAQPTDQGLFSWFANLVSNLVHDIAAVTSAIIMVVNGGQGKVGLSGGGTIEVGHGGEVWYRAGSGYKAESDLTEDPNVWY